MKRPSHRPYYLWPTFVLRAIATRLHVFMPWTALAAQLELRAREEKLDEPFVVHVGIE